MTGLHISIDLHRNCSLHDLQLRKLEHGDDENCDWASSESAFPEAGYSHPTLSALLDLNNQHSWHVQGKAKRMQAVSP